MTTLFQVFRECALMHTGDTFYVRAPQSSTADKFLTLRTNPGSGIQTVDGYPKTTAKTYAVPKAPYDNEPLGEFFQSAAKGITVSTDEHHHWQYLGTDKEVIVINPTLDVSAE
jgi:hypothetical protein